MDTFARNDEIVRNLKEQTERDKRRIEQLEKRLKEGSKEDSKKKKA